MANRYENHKVIAKFDLGVKPGQIMALTTFKQKLTKIQSKCSGSHEEKTELVIKELESILIEEVLRENKSKPSLVVKGAEQVRLELIGFENITEDELRAQKDDLSSKFESLEDLRYLIAKGHLNYDQLERGIMETSNPAFLKQVIRNQKMPNIELLVDNEVLKIASFEIPKEWMDEGVIKLNDYEVKKVAEDGTVVFSIPDKDMPNKHIGDDRFVVVKVDKKTNEFRVLRYLKNTNVKVCVDLVKIRKAKRQCPYYKLVKLHDADGLIQSTLEDIVALKEKLNYS